MKDCYNDYIQILNEELVPAMGCTEPIAIAFAAAKAKEVLNETIKKLIVYCSSNIIKNVRCVRVPNTDGMIGVAVAALVGITAGDSSKHLEVISSVSDEEKNRVKQLLAENICEVYKLDTDLTLHIILEAYGDENCVAVEITHTHTHIASIKRNGELLDSNAYEGSIKPANRSCLNVKDIVDFANEIDLELVKPLLDRQIECNMAISQEGMSGKYGVKIGQLILSENENSLSDKMAAATAAASEARMDGCSLPVVTNSGSGNQGITASIPVIVFCNEKGLTKEQMYRGLLVSNLLTVHQKTGIGHLSAFCGAVSAAAASAGAVTYLQNGTVEQIGNAIKNTLASLSGVICDGAKVTCAFKITSGIHAATLASKMALANTSYEGEIGILKDSVEDTIATVGTLASDGMCETDKVILDLMLRKD